MGWDISPRGPARGAQKGHYEAGHTNSPHRVSIWRKRRRVPTRTSHLCPGGGAQGLRYLFRCDRSPNCSRHLGPDTGSFATAETLLFFCCAIGHRSLNCILLECGETKRVFLESVGPAPSGGRWQAV